MIRGGRNNITSVPAFSRNAKKLLLCTANTVSIFSVDTGLKIASLEDHRAPVTTVIVDYDGDKDNEYCWTASLDGKIRIWEFSTPKLVKTFDTHFPVYSLVAIPLKVCRSLVIYVSVEDYSNVSKDLFGKIRRYDLIQEEFQELYGSGVGCGGETLKEMEEPKSIVISRSGELVGVCDKRNIHIWNASFGKTDKETTLNHSELVTVFAFHPTKRMVAAGDVTGRVLIWKNIDNDAENCDLFSWHSAEVTVLEFSFDGAFLYSGVKDGVVVVWELDTEKKQLLPKKIESPLSYFILSSDPTLSSAVCTDNQIHFLETSSMEILRTIPGIKPPISVLVKFVCYVKPTMHISLTKTVSIDSSCGIAAFYTANHRLQLYNLITDTEVSEVQVCDINHQPDDGEVRDLVSAVALSRNGSLMITAEVRFDSMFYNGGLVSLKFWAFEPVKKTFGLSTVVNQPHGEAAITSIAFNSVRSMAVTICSAGDFKTWLCKSSDKNTTLEEDSNWICHGAGSYKKKQITAAAFCGDGTLLALAATTVITLWNPLNTELLYVFGKGHTPISELAFAGVGFLIAASYFPGTTPDLSAWDLMTFGLSWSYKLYIEAIATEADSSYFAVLTWFPNKSVKSDEKIFRGRDGAILLFDGSGPKPAAIWTVMKARGGSLSFVEDGKKSGTLLAYVNRSHEYVIFDPFGDETLATSAKDYEDLLAAITKKRKRSSRRKTSLGERPWETMFSGSSLNIPPFHDACSNFFDTRMRKKIWRMIFNRVEMNPEVSSTLNNTNGKRKFY